MMENTHTLTHTHTHTGINSVHTYAAHKALHTLTLAQQCGMSDTKSPILIPVSTPPSDTRLGSTSPDDPPTTQPSQLKKSSPPVLQGGQSKIRTPVISPPIATLTNPTPLTSLFPCVRTPVSMSPVPGTLPLAVNPIHNPFMTGLTRFTTPGMFPPILISAKNPLLSMGALQSRSSSAPGIQTQAMKVNSDLSTHMQMVLQLQNAQLNALSSRGLSTANLPTSHDPLVSQAIEKAGYILKYRSNPPIYCIAPPEEIMPSSPLRHCDPSLYEHTIEYIDTLSSSYTTRDKGGKEKYIKKTSMMDTSRRGVESHGASSSGESLPPQAQERTRQTSIHQENVERSSRTAVSDHETDDEELHQTISSSSHHWSQQTEEKRSSSQHFSRHQVKSSLERRRISPPPLLRIPQDTDKDEPNSILSSRVAASPFSSKKQPSIATPTLPKTVTTPTYLPSLATTAPTGLFKTLNNKNNMSSSFSPAAAAVMAPSVVSLPHGVGYCVMMNPLTGLPVPTQPTMVLPTVSPGTAITPGAATAAALQPQLPVLIPAQPAAVAVNPPTAVVAGGLNSPQMVYYLMADSSSLKTQQTSNTPTYMVIQPQQLEQQEQKQKQSSRIIHPTTPPTLSTGSTTTKHISLHKRTSPEDLLAPPKPKCKKLIKQGSESRLTTYCNHTDGDPDRLNSKCESHDMQHRSHVMRHRSHDTQSRSHDTRCASDSSTESIEVDSNEDLHHEVTPHSASVEGRGQYVSEEENMVTESKEEVHTEGEEKSMASHTHQQLASTNSCTLFHIHKNTHAHSLTHTPHPFR